MSKYEISNLFILDSTFESGTISEEVIKNSGIATTKTMKDMLNEFSDELKEILAKLEELKSKNKTEGENI